MDWFALSSRFYLDMDDAGISEGAQTLLSRACGYIANNETSGFLPFAAIKKLGLTRVPGRLEQLEKEKIAVRICEVSEPHECSVGALSLSHPCAIPVLSAALSVIYPEGYRCSIRGWDFPGWWKWNEPLERLVKKQKADRDRIAEKRRNEENVARQSHDVAPTHYITLTDTEVVEVSDVSTAQEIETPSQILDLGPRCERHLADPNPPACRGCADARRTAEAIAAQEAVDWQQIKSEAARRRAEITAVAIEACDMCDDAGYYGTTVCDHDPDRPETHRRGMEMVRAVLARSAQETSSIQSP